MGHLTGLSEVVGLGLKQRSYLGCRDLRGGLLSVVRVFETNGSLI